MRNIEKEKKDKIVKNVKRVSVGAGISSAAIISGVMISESNKTISHEQDNSNSVITNGNFALNTNATIVTQNPTWTAEYNAIKNLLNTVSTSALTTAGIISPSDVTQTTLDALVGTTSQNLMAKLVRVATTATGNTAPTADATSAFIRYQIVEKNNQSNIWSNSDSTFSNDLRASTFSKSNNQKTLDAANPTVTPSTTITNSFFTSASATLKTNYTLSNAAGATIDTVVLTSSPTAAQVTGDSVPYTANANVNLKLGTATRVVPITLTYNKVNKQPAIDLVSLNINSLTLSGDKWSSKISSTNIDFGTNVAAISSFAKVQYQIDGGSWTDLFATPSNATSVQSSISSGIALPNGALLGASNVSFRITETTSKPASHIYNLPTTRVVSTSALTQVIDIKDILSEIASGDTFKITGNSKGAVLTAKTYPNINLEVKVNGSSTWQTIAQANTALAALNLWNNNSNAFQTLNFDYRITSTNGAALYDSSATATASIVGTTGKSDSKPFDSTALSGLIKLIETTAISGAVSGNTKALTLPTISAPNNTEIEFEVFNGATTLVKGTKTQVETWIAANNLWNSTTNAWRAASIKARIKLTNATGFALSSNQEVELWNSTSNTLSKLVETQAQTISISGASNAMTISQPANTPATTGFDFEYELVGVSGFTGWKTKSEIETWISTNNLWDNNANAWKATGINTRLKPSNGFELSNTQTKSIWGSNPTNVKYITTTAISGAVSGNTKALTLPTISAPNNTEIEFEVFNGATSLVKGTKTQVESWIAANNLWNSTTNAWRATSIKARIKLTNATGFALSSNQEVELWNSTSNSLSKLVETQAQTISISGASNAMTISQPANTPATTGFDFEYELVGVSGFTGWKTKSEIETWISTNNLWDQNSGTNGAWKATAINARLKPASGFILDNQNQQKIWDSATATNVKFVDTSSLVTAINALRVTGDDKHLVWDTSAVAALASKLNLIVEFAFTNNATMPSSGFANISTLPNAWPTSSVQGTNKHIWIKVSPKDANFATTPASQTPFDIASTSGIQGLPLFYVVGATDLNGVTLQAGSTSKNFNFATPIKNEFDYEFSTDGSTWKTLTQLNVELSATSTEGIWDSINQSWRITSIQVRPKAKAGYVLDSNTAKTIWTSSNPGTIAKWIDTTGILTSLSTSVVTGSSSTHTNVDWTSAATILSDITARGLKVEFLSSTTAQASLGSLASGWTSSLPTTLSEVSTSRYLYARISANNSPDQLTSTGQSNYVDLSTSSQIKNVKTEINTDSFNIDSNLIKGDSHNLTGSTTFSIANTNLSAHQKNGLELVFTLSDWTVDSNLPAKLGVSGPIPAQMTETQLKALFNGSAGNLWSLSQTNWAATIKAKLVAKPGFTLTSDREVTFDLSQLSLQRWIDTANLITQVRDGQATKVKAETTSTNDATTWHTPLLANLGYGAPVSGFKFLVGDYSTLAQVNAASTASWVSSLPTSLDYNHSVRHVWVKFDAATDYILSNVGPIDLTTSSGIQVVKSKVDTLAQYASIDLSRIAFTGSTNAAQIDESLAGTVPTGSKIMYQVSYSDGSRDTNNNLIYKDSTWMDKTSMIAFLKTNTVKIRSLKSHLESSDASKYVVVNDKVENVNISNFYSFRDVTTELTALTVNNIKVLGVLGQTDAIQVILPTALTQATLGPKGLVLQMSINGAPFKNFVAQTSAQAADTSKGFEAALAGTYDILTIADMGPTSSLEFRVLPWTSDENIHTTITDVNNWNAIVDDIKVKTSDIINNTRPTVLNWNVAALPKLVHTSASWLSALNLTGSTKQLQINGLTTSDIGTLLDQQNTQNGYNQYIEAGFQLQDGNIAQNLFFRRSDFITWLSGSATTAMKVYNSTTNAMENLTSSDVTPHWNNIDLESIKTRFISTNTGFRVSDPGTQKLITHTGNVYNVKKWTDLTSFINSLRTLVISGDTAHLNQASLDLVVSQLTSAFGKDAFDIEATPTITNSTPDFSSATTNDLPSEINYLYELGFRIKPNASRFDLISSTLAAPTITNPEVIWDKNSSSTINKFVHISTAALANVTLTGDTRNWTFLAPQDTLKTNVNGVMSATGTYSGVEIMARVDSIPAFQSWRTIETLKADMAAVGLNLFDGTWGRDKIDLKYQVKTGYTADSAELLLTSKPNVTSLNRFIDITSLLTQAQAGVVIKSKNTSEGWWNESSSAYDDHKSWTGYVDNKDFDLEDITVASRLHVEIEYSLDNSTWTKTKPTQLNDVAANRNLYIRYVATTDYLPGEAPILSDLTSKNITTSSGVRNVLTNVNISSTDLSKIQFEGDTRRMTESLTSAAIQAHTHVEYSITNFMAKDKASAIAELAKIGIVNSGATASIFNAYNASMTWSELQAFIVSISPIDTIKEILRNSIAARVVADTGYSITQPDDAAKRLKIDVSKLYTLKDITPAVNLLQLASKAGDQDGINLYGIKATNPFEADGVTPTKEGILVQIPDALYDFMQAHGLKIQFTKDGITSGASTTIAPTASWSDAPLSSFAAAAVPGSPTVSHGFLTRLDAINGKYSFIGFRLVPTVNDENTASTAQANDALTAHYDATMTKLFTSTGAFPNKQYTLQAPFYSIDTSKIPTVIRVDKIDLTQISVTGDTRFADILRGSDMHSQIDAENGDQSLDDNLQLVYSIDLKDGTYIDTDKSNPNALWLTELDMEAYLKGDLIVSGGKVINKNNPSQIVEAFDASVISARGLKNGDAVIPKYLDINTKLYVKWSSMTSDYVANSDFIPSKIEPFAVSTTASTYRKWFDGNAFNNLITQLEISGTTQSATSYTIDYSKATALQPTELDKHNLKMQYSFDGQVWQDNKLDFSTQSWAIQTARQIYMRVVPKTYTGTTTITNFVEVDGIKVDYQFAQNKKAEALANTSTVTGAVRNFLVYLDIDKTQLSALSISGNSFELDSAALNESSIDTEVDKYSAVEIQYLFNGVWYNKAALLAEMQRIRTSITNADKAAALVMPTDFIHTTVQARWHVLDVNNFVIKDKTISTGTVNANQQVSAGEEITKTNFKTFINAWAIQDKTTNNFRASIGVQNALFSLSAAQDTTSNQFKLSANMIDISKFNFEALNSLGLKAQYLTQEANPSLELSNTNWIDFAWTKTGDKLIINDAAWTTGSSTPLWFRIVPIDSSTSVSSTTTSNGLATTVTPMAIDTTKVKTRITTDSAALLALAISGDTQSLLSTDETPFTVPKLVNGVWDIQGVTEDPSKAKTEAELRAWLVDNGLRLNYRVTATRTKGAFISGQSYEFNTFADLKTALATTNLNFDRSSLEVRWDFSNTTNFEASDTAWVHPTSASSVVNVVYTEDTYSLQATTLRVSGNNLKLQAPVPTDDADRFIPANIASAVLTQAELAKLGLKLQYNWTDKNGQPDSTTWSDVAPDGSTGNSLNGNKDYWVRYAPIDANYKLASNRFSSNAEQITRLNVEDIKLAIPFNLDKAATLAMINAAALSGTTYDFNWEAGKTLPSINASADGQTHGHMQYSRDGIRWEDTIAQALSDTDHYNNGVLALDKDRDQGLFVRFVYSETSGNVTPVNSQFWVFTDLTGNEFTLKELEKTISISDLVQPVYTSATLAQLTGQNSILVNGLVNPLGGPDFAGITWKQLADYGLFKPKFVAGINEQVANFNHMWYDGQIGAHAPYIFNMGQNPFDSSDVQAKTLLDALLPRHTHLEYRWTAGGSASWSTWTSTPPQDIVKNSNYNGFETRLVADAGYSLDAFTTKDKFMDGSTRVVTSIDKQDWSKSYSVVVELLTKDVHLPTKPEEQAQFIGWTEGPNGLSATGTFFTDGAGGDHHPSMDANILKNIVVTLLNGSNQALDFLRDDKGYVLEWNVQNGGRDISWTDSRGTAASGWHPSVPGNMNVAPGKDIPWYGSYPTSLKNGDVVQARLRARDGFVISNDDLSNDYNAATKTSRWSHTLSFAPITSLTHRIVVPTDFAFYDPKHLTDFNGQPITINGLMPTINFSGNEGSGGLHFAGGPSNPHYHYEVAVLRPIYSLVYQGETVDNNQKPKVGYGLQTVDYQMSGPSDKNVEIYNISTGFVADWKAILTSKGAWQKPEDVSDLNVGDVIVSRLVADAGYGFEWEDKTLPFIDNIYPKERTYDAFGTSMDAATLAGLNIDLTKNEGIAPIPVRGLTVLPKNTLSELVLEYSTDPAKKLNNGLSEIMLNHFPVQRDKYRYEYTVTSSATGVVSNPMELSAMGVLKGLRNDDIVTIKVIPLNTSFVLDPSYNNSPITLTVQGLADPLNADGIIRPVIELAGYDGAGTIKAIHPHNNQTPTQWSTPDTTYLLGRPMLQGETSPAELIWQYQVVHEDPRGYTAQQLASLPWVNDIPNDLKQGDFVRMRVGTVDPSKVALSDGGTKWVYSIDPTNSDPNIEKNSWLEVKNLNLKVDQIDYQMEITGFIKRTRLTYSASQDTPESNHVDVEMRVKHPDGTFSAWVPYTVGNDLNSKGILTQLDNGDVVELRVVAKDGYQFNPSDDDAANGIHVSSATVSVNGQNVTKYYLQKDSWTTQPISGLKIYMNTESVRVELTPDYIINMDGRPLAPNGKPLDGNATIKPALVTGLNTIVDINGQMQDVHGVKYEDIVKPRYILRSIDSFTGQQLQDVVLPMNPDGTPQLPKELNNGDVITIELYSTNSNYELSNPQRQSITVSGLVTVVDEDVTDPFLTFSGESGKGSVSIAPQAPRKTKWVYAVTSEPAAGQALPTISEDTTPTTGHPIDPDQKWIDAHPGVYYWTSTPPTNLVNGDYVIAMLVSAIPGSGGLKVNNVTPGRPSDATPMNTRWVQVQGLAQRIDLSKYQFNLVDADNLWTPNADNGFKVDDLTTPGDESHPIDATIKTYAFKIEGHQEGQASLALNSLLETANIANLLTDRTGKPLPASIASVVQWAFAVNNDPSPTGNYNWSTTLPKALFNGQYVHAKLVAKVGTTNIDVYGYRPQVFKVDGLDAQASISNKVVTLVAAILGGIGGLGAAVGTLLFLRKRKKKLHFSDKF